MLPPIIPPCSLFSAAEATALFSKEQLGFWLSIADGHDFTAGAGRGERRRSNETPFDTKNAPASISPYGAHKPACALEARLLRPQCRYKTTPRMPTPPQQSLRRGIRATRCHWPILRRRECFAACRPHDTAAEIRHTSAGRSRLRHFRDWRHLWPADS